MADQRKALADDDPYALVAMRFKPEPGVDSDEQMTRCFVEEFAIMGFSADRILRLFQIPTYTATHAVLDRRGEDFVASIIAGVFRTPPPPVLDAISESEER